jgi:uncharacterized protein YbgA (DUF1722 family)
MTPQNKFLQELKRQLEARTVSNQTVIEFEDRLKLFLLFMNTVDCVSNEDIHDVEDLLNQINEYKALLQQMVPVRKKKSWLRKWFNRII